MQLAEVLQNLLEEAEVHIIKIFGESSGGEQNGGNGGGRGQQCEIFSDQWVQKKHVSKLTGAIEAVVPAPTIAQRIVSHHDKTRLLLEQCITSIVLMAF